MEIISLSTFLKLAFERKYHFKRSWRIQLNCEIHGYRKDPYYLYPEDGKVYFKDEQDVIFEVAHKLNKQGMLIHHKQLIKLEPGALPNLSEEVETMYGVWLHNAIVFAVYGDRIPYVNGEFNKQMLSKILFDAKESGVIDKVKDMPILVDSLSKLESIHYGDLDWISKSLTKEMYAEDKRSTAAVKEELKKNADSLNVVSTQAKMDKFITGRSKEHYSKIGVNEYVTDKIHADVIKKTDSAFGSEKDMLGNPTPYISTPLKEGLDLDNFPAYVNSARAGSYGRGAMTAFAGAEVNNDYRGLWEHTVQNGDCKTKRGIFITPQAWNFDRYVGMALVGTDKFLTKADLQGMIGKRIQLRTSGGCMFLKGDICSVCCGKELAKFPDSIATGTSLVDSNIMLKAMASIHSTALKMVEVNLSDYCDD